MVSEILKKHGIHQADLLFVPDGSTDTMYKKVCNAILEQQRINQQLEFQLRQALLALDMNSTALNGIQITSDFIKVGTTEVKLSGREPDILKALLSSPELLTKESLLDNVWGKQDHLTARSMSVFMTKLRKKVEPIIEIKTIHGKGFKTIVK